MVLTISKPTWETVSKLRYARDHDERGTVYVNVSDSVYREFVSYTAIWKQEEHFENYYSINNARLIFLYKANIPIKQ